MTYLDAVVILTTVLPWTGCWQIRTPPGSQTVRGASPKISAIFPGTKWCGSGNVSQNDDDLGYLEQTDACCREHDFCPDVIESGSSAHGLQNTALYTRLNCDCDYKFLECLRSSSETSESSKVVGVIYFDALGTRCFQLDYPVTGCLKQNIFSKRCEEYSYDTSAEKQWQWFDLPLF